jgi:hypothetical protein
VLAVAAVIDELLETAHGLGQTVLELSIKIVQSPLVANDHT